MPSVWCGFLPCSPDQGFPACTLIYLVFPWACVILIILRMMFELEILMKILPAPSAPVCNIGGIAKPPAAATAVDQVLGFWPC